MKLLCNIINGKGTCNFIFLKCKHRQIHTSDKTCNGQGCIIGQTCIEIKELENDDNTRTELQKDDRKNTATHERRR